MFPNDDYEELPKTIMDFILYYLEGVLAYFDEEIKLQQVVVHFLTARKKIILFCVPGAFSLTCSMRHVPWFVENVEEWKGKGIDENYLRKCE